MPRPRFDRLDAGKREHILKVAAEEFVSHGYRGASLNHIIERLGLSKGSFYYYFDDKADLFTTVVQSAWDALLQGRPLDLTNIGAETFWPHMEALARDQRRRLRAQPWLVFVTRILTAPQAGMNRLLAEKFAEMRALQETLLRRGQQLGVVRTDLPEGLLLSLFSAVDGAGDRWLLDNWDHLPPDEVDEVADRAFTLMRQMLEPPNPARPKEQADVSTGGAR
jgi:AcrR family transcriptional regulator